MQLVFRILRLAVLVTSLRSVVTIQLVTMSTDVERVSGEWKPYFITTDRRADKQSTFFFSHASAKPVNVQTVFVTVLGVSLEQVLI